jgi:hypothetical protein
VAINNKEYKMNYGMKVTIKFSKTGIYGMNGHTHDVLRNVTEIHYNFNHMFAKNAPKTSTLNEVRIAFESEVHGTGNTYAITDILEFTTSLETERAGAF